MTISYYLYMKIPVVDYAFITAFAKTTDPGSVVRGEGE